MDLPRVGIIGGGISGLSCSAELAKHGVDLCVFDQGYRVGGRSSTRKQQDGRVIADHGVPFFDAREIAFVDAVHQWINAGVCERWEGRYIGTPCMGSICEHLGQGLNIQSNARVEEIQQDADGRWKVVLQDGAGVESSFDQLVLATQPRETVRLLEAHSSSLTEIARSVPMSTVWVLMMTIEDPLDGLDAIYAFSDDDLARLIRDDLKPGRDRRAGRSAVVLHASTDWSNERKAMDREEAARQLTELGLAQIGSLLERDETEFVVSSAIAHRWGSAFPINGFTERCARDDSKNLTICGDWMGWNGLNLGIESAWMSGRTAARAVLGQ